MSISTDMPRLYPAVEMTRTKAGEHRIKTYNGLVLLEVNNLAGVAEAELVKQQAACCRKPLRLLWLQRTKRQNMGTLHPARRRASKE